MLEYFEDTLANVGLPEVWLKCYSNFVTRVKNKFVKREFESNRKKQVSLVKSKPQFSPIKSKTVSCIKSKTVTRETTDANDRDSVG